VNVFLKERLQNTKFKDVDVILWERSVLLRSREVAIQGIVFEVKGNEMVQTLDNSDFKASKGWLKHFKKPNTTSSRGFYFRSMGCELRNGVQ
jgi:hypothetical protein